MEKTMEDFEGVKRITNKLDLKVEEIFTMLKNYQDAIGTLTMKENRIIADTEGKYFIDIYLSGNQIVIERKLEDGFELEDYVMGENLKSIDMSVADRMIEQIYDFLIDFIKNDGNVSEFITGVKSVFTVKYDESVLFDKLAIYNTDKFAAYEIRNKKFMKELAVYNVGARRELVTIKYADIKNNRYMVIKPPYTTIYISKSSQEEKTTFIGTAEGKELKIKADYSNQHYLIELDEIVIGAIDMLHHTTGSTYRIEINNEQTIYLVLAALGIVDIYTRDILYGKK